MSPAPDATTSRSGLLKSTLTKAFKFGRSFSIRSAPAVKTSIKYKMMIQIRNLGLILVTSAVTYIVLLSLSSYHEIIMKCGLITLAIYLSDIVIKIVWNSFHGPTISNLRDRAVLITGCDTGFGNVLARQLDKKGVTVFAGCLFPAAEGAQKLKRDCSESLHILQLNVTKEEEVNAAVKSVEKILNGKPLFSIVNNAGITALCELEFHSVEDQKKIMDVNNFGVSRVTKAFLPLLKKSKGRIVIVASQASTFAVLGHGAYTMSKFAVLAFAETLRREVLKWSISVHTIEPFMYATDMTNKETIFKKMKEEFNQTAESVQNKYAEEDYIKSYEVLFDVLMLTAQPGHKIHEVTDCLADAAIGKYPKLRYVPSLRGKFLNLLIANIPKEAMDLIMILFVALFSKGSKGKHT